MEKRCGKMVTGSTSFKYHVVKTPFAFSGGMCSTSFSLNQSDAVPVYVAVRGMRHVFDGKLFQSLLILSTSSFSNDPS